MLELRHFDTSSVKTVFLNISTALFKHCLIQALPCSSTALFRHVRLLQLLPCSGIVLCTHTHTLMSGNYFHECHAMNISIPPTIKSFTKSRNLRSPFNTVWIEFCNVKKRKGNDMNISSVAALAAIALLLRNKMPNASGCLSPAFACALGSTLRIVDLGAHL